MVRWYNFDYFLKQGYYIKNRKYYTQECSIKLIKEAKMYSRKAIQYEKKLIEIVPLTVQFRSNTFSTGKGFLFLKAPTHNS
jgi:hypothetical protein